MNEPGVTPWWANDTWLGSVRFSMATMYDMGISRLYHDPGLPPRLSTSSSIGASTLKKQIFYGFSPRRESKFPG